MYNSTGDTMEKKHAYGREILKQLHAKGYEAYFVGGYVRDTLLKIETKDIDITTNATIEDTQTIFDKVIITGEKFGTVTVLYGGYSFEVTTYRTEEQYSNNRHPDTVQFVRSLEKDLARRDFTINQLIMDVDGKVYDHFNGLDDLKAGVIRTINNPLDRFKEDALRMLRAFRFVGKTNFSIEAKTLKAISELKHLVKELSIERIQNEFERLFNHPYKQKALKYIIETDFHIVIPYIKGIVTLSKITTDYDALDAFTIIVLEHQEAMQYFKFSNKQKEAIRTRITLHKQTKTDSFLPEHLFMHKKDICLQVNHLNVLLGFGDQANHIEKLDKTLPLRRVQALAFKGEDILKHIPLKRPAYISLIIDHLLVQVLHKKVSNDYEALKTEALTFVKDLEKSE